MLVRIKGMVTAVIDEQKHKTTDMPRADTVAAFDHPERRAALAARIKDCISGAFYAIGAGAQTQELIYWNLYVTGNLGRDEVLDKPAEFIEGVKAIYGEAGVKVFEYMLIRELKKEFGVTAELDEESAKENNAVSDLIRLITSTASES